MARTAYEEALERIRSGEDTNGSSIPSYMVAGDTLNVSNQNKTFLESAVDVVDAIPQFIGTSIISGANQIYNIPADVGNLFGGDFDRSDTGDVIEAIDSNLGVFYQEHQESVDLVGFMVSSALPGLGGIKILNAGQKSLRGALGAGKFGTNTSKALGLLVPDKGAKIAKAIKEVSNNSAVPNLASRNALRAIGAGVGQNALEALAFETAVTATLFNSPILENQDVGDFVLNVSFGAGVFGIIGGAVDATKISFALKGAANKAAIEARPWTFIEDTAKAAKGYEKIALDFEQLARMPKVPTAGLDSSRAEFLKQAADTKVATLNGRIREEIGLLSGGDQDVAENLFQLFKGRSENAQKSAFIGLIETSKMGVKSKAFARHEKLWDKAMAGKPMTTAEIEEFATSSIQVGYSKLWGEGAGKVFSEKPVITAMSDTLTSASAKIKVTTTSVKAGAKSWFFNTKFNVGKTAGDNRRAWNILIADPLEANARYAWAANLPRLNPTAKTPFTVHVNDIPLMEKVFTEVGEEALEHVRFLGLKEGEAIGNNLQDFLGVRKIELANKILRIKGVSPKIQEEIAAIVNVKSSLLSGEVLHDVKSTYNIRDILALQSHAEVYTKLLVSQGARKVSDGVVNIWKIPQHVKMTYDSLPFAGINNHVIENMAIIRAQQKLYTEGLDRASAFILGKDFARFQEIDTPAVRAGAVPSGAGASLFAAESANYGSLAATVSDIGRVTTDVIRKKVEGIREVLEPLLYKLAQKQEAYIEWSVLQQRVRSIEGEYGINVAGDALEPVVLLRWRKAVLEANETGAKPPARPVLTNPAMEARIELATPEVRDLARAHIETNGARTNPLAGIRTAQGLDFNRAPDVFYPIPINPKDFPHFAIVVDESITSGNHSKTLFATTAEELGEQIHKLKQNPHLRVYTKGDAEDYFRRIGQFEQEKTLSSNYLDVEAHRKGISAPFIVATDSKKIVDDMLTWHIQRETSLVREAVLAKYEVQFEELKSLGKDFTDIELSRFDSMTSLEFAEESIKNPFGDYIKTALGLSKSEQYPWWTSFNKMADEGVSRVLKRVKNVFREAKTPEDLTEINRLLDKAGYKGAAYDESMEIFANLGPARGALAKTVQKANSIMATVVLRWDMLNAVNNAVSANVLLGAETRAVVKAIERGDKEAVGALADLTRIGVPGTSHTIFSPMKLIANSIRDFGTNTPKMQFYRDNGYITSISAQYRNTIEDIAYRPGDSITSWGKQLDKKIFSLKNIGDAGEFLTGNKLAEEFNRFVAADVMKQMTDVAVTRGLMTRKEQLAYINTFVNRTQGNYLASQRPLAFQGPIGQAIGLFQTYQFNLMQQLLRHVGEGHAKDAMTLLALQGTIHGMNGLPAFNAINTHLVGTASGNTSHRDAYDAVYGIAGKQAGDWLMYGLASNAAGLFHPDLKVNLYTRGDINPRHVLILPTDPSQVAIIQASGKMFANIFNTARKLAAGGDISTTLLQGLEHNGISRPLAGIAQTLEGFNNPLRASYSTSKKGNVIASNDLLSWANLTRMVGGKPLDEAIALDATYRFKAYGLADAKKRQVLGQAIKTTMIAGQGPTREQIEDFAEQYTAVGGRQEEFNKWFGQLYKTANLSQANKIQQSLRSPFTQSMQRIMGGRELRDFTE